MTKLELITKLDKLAEKLIVYRENKREYELEVIQISNEIIDIVTDLQINHTKLIENKDLK